MIIEIKNIYKSYLDSNFNLKNINLKIKESEKIGIIGKNGTGKSTVLKIINGVVDIDKGQIFYKNKNIKELSKKEILNFRKKVAYIFQHFNLLENKSVYYHLTLIYKLNHQKINFKEIDEILKFMNLTHLKNQLCLKLSGGQKQKLSIAMAILQKPEIILCDEISASLDNESETEVFKLLINLCFLKKIALVIVSHNLDILKNYCDKILYIEDGIFKEELIPNPNKNSINSNYLQHIKDYIYNV